MKGKKTSEVNHIFYLESQNHRMVWVRRDLTDHLVPTSLPSAGTPSTRSPLPIFKF